MCTCTTYSSSKKGDVEKWCVAVGKLEGEQLNNECIIVYRLCAMVLCNTNGGQWRVIEVKESQSKAIKVTVSQVRVIETNESQGREIAADEGQWRVIGVNESWRKAIKVTVRQVRLIEVKKSQGREIAADKGQERVIRVNESEGRK